MTAASFDFSLALREFGVFAGNPVSGVAFTSQVDHFRVLERSCSAAAAAAAVDTSPPVLSWGGGECGGGVGDGVVVDG